MFEYLKKSPIIHESAYISDFSSVNGDVIIKEDASIWPMAVLRGDMHSIKIGKKSNVQDGTIVHITHASKYNSTGSPVIIGDNVTIGHNCTIHGCTINNLCLIGIGSTILDNAVLEENVMLGAGSIVSPGKVLEGGYLYYGSPVKKIRKLSKEEIDFFKYSADNYVKLKNQYLEQKLN